MNNQKLPNFFIAGAAKSGTSSLWQYLKANEEVFMPADELHKEPAFFSEIKNRGAINLERYSEIFKEADKRHKRIGESSTAYLTDPGSAGLIYDFNPAAKIIILLRNPAERAYSLYCWMVQDGYEYAGTFERALELEASRINRKIPNFLEPEYYYNYLYFHSGLYYEQVKRYNDLFGSNLLVIKFEDFVNDFNASYGKVCSFLGIRMNELDVRPYNVSKSVYSAKLQFVLRKMNINLNKIGIRFFSMRFPTKESRDRLLKLGLKKQRPPRLKKDVKKRLIKGYADDIRKLSNLTGIFFDDWLDT